MVFVEDIINVAADLSTAQLVDISTYGGSNPARNTFALYNYLFKRAVDNTDTQLTLDNTSPLTVSFWQFNLPAQDGNFVYITFGFPIWAAGSYLANACVYYNGLYYQCLVTTSAIPGSDPTKWAVITDILGTVLNLSGSNVTNTQGYAFSTAVAEAGPIGDDMASLGPKIVGGKCKNINDAAGVIYGASLVESAWMNFRRQDYTNAQQIMDYVDQNFAVNQS